MNNMLKNESFEIYQGNSLQLLQSLPSNSVDGLITDPPYSSGGLHSLQRQQATNEKYIKSGKFSAQKYNFHGDNKDQRSYMRWLEHWLSECFRVMKDGAPFCIFTDWRQIPTVSDAVQWSEFVWRGVFVWDKRNARPNKGKFRQSTEYVIWGSKGAIRGDDNPVYLKGLVSAAIPSINKRHHQTEKPQEVMQELVSVVPEGGVVLDPFMGSGSTGVAALATGRKFIGMEMSELYFDTARERLGVSFD